MAIESVEGRIALLLVCNSPVFIGFGSLFFSSWGEFFHSFISGYDIGPLSWILNRHWVMTWENSKLFLFLVLIGLALYGEYRFFWPSPPSPTPIQFISSCTFDRPNPSLNSDPACIALRSLSASRFLGSAQRLGAGGAG